MKSFSHIDDRGEASMVDVGGKEVQTRMAKASGVLICQPETLVQLQANGLPKGNVLAVARVAGIQAAKRTDEWIPLCHSLPLEHVGIEFEIDRETITITATVRTSSKTGVEMEALTAVSAAALTLYDMMKAVDKSMRIDAIHVVEKIKR